MFYTQPPPPSTQYHTIPHNTTQYHVISMFSIPLQHPPLNLSCTAKAQMCPWGNRKQRTISHRPIVVVVVLQSISMCSIRNTTQYHICLWYTKPNYFSSSNCHLTISQHVFHPGQDVANGQRRPRKLFFTVSELELGKRVAVAVAEPGQERIADPPTTRQHCSLS